MVNGDFTDNVIPGWIGTDIGAAFNFGVFNPAIDTFPAQAPEGQNIAYIVKGAVYQTLTSALATGDYILTIQVGQLPNRTPSPLTIELRAGTTVLTQANSPMPDRRRYVYPGHRQLHRRGGQPTTWPASGNPAC